MIHNRQALRLQAGAFVLFSITRHCGRTDAIPRLTKIPRRLYFNSFHAM